MSERVVDVMSETWNGVAASWEQQAGFVDELLAAATRVLLDAAQVGDGDDVLDLATGPGGAGIAAADRVGSRGTVTLADVADQMVAVAARRVADRPGVSALVCDQAAIAADDASFDAVIVRHGLMFAVDAIAAVREGIRVLRPGGCYAAMTWDRRDANPWLGMILDAVGEQFGVTFPPPGIPGPFSLDDADHLADVLRRAGLSDVEVQTVATPMSIASLAAWWERVPQLTGPLATALAGMEPDVRDAIRRRALASGAAHARSADGELVHDGSVLVASGRRPDDTLPG